MGADRSRAAPARAKPVPLASLPVPQRRLIFALVEAAKAADSKAATTAEAGDGADRSLAELAPPPTVRKRRAGTSEAA